MTRLFDRRPLGWLLLGIFSMLYACRSLVGAVEAGLHGDGVILFWRVVELVFFGWLASSSIRRTTAPATAPLS